jgi:hypothetical protein
MTNGLTRDTSGRLHCSYSFDDGGGNQQIAWRYSDDSGATWSAATPLTAGATGLDSQEFPAIVAFPNRDLLVVWNGFSGASPATKQIRWCYYTFGTSTWSAAADLTAAPATFHQYTHDGRILALDSVGNAHLIYWGRDDAGISVIGENVYYNKYTFGVGWQPRTILWGNVALPQTNNAQYPCIIVGPGDLLHAACSHDDLVWGVKCLYYRQWDGFSWDPEETIQDDSGLVPHLHSNMFPDMVIDAAGVIDAAWCGILPAITGYQIRTKQRSAIGVWGAPTDQTSDNLYTQLPVSIVRSTDGNIHIIWGGVWAAAPFGMSQIRERTSIGGAWGAIAVLTASATGVYSPYGLWGYVGGVNPATGYRFIYLDDAPRDVLFYGDATNNPAPGPAGPTVGGGGAKGGPGCKAWYWNNYLMGD